MDAATPRRTTMALIAASAAVTLVVANSAANTPARTAKAFADPGVYRGFDRIRDFFIAQGEMWKSQRYEPEEFIPVGVDHVVVPQKIVSVGRDGVEVVAHTANPLHAARRQGHVHEELPDQD
jgi:hypothetical protein